MSRPAELRDSTQIVLSSRAIEDLRDDLERRFTLTLYERDDLVRIIASPTVIKDVNGFLVRSGVNLP